MPDPFGGDRNILLALEDGQVVALSNVVPGTKDCGVTLERGSINSFVDCHDDKLKSTDLARYQHRGRTAVGAQQGRAARRPASPPTGARRS